MRSMAQVGLYVITGEKFARGRPLAAVVQAAIDGGAQAVQLREKEMPLRRLLTEGACLRDITRRAGVLFLVNDRVDVALALDADGVHLGQDDMPVAVARRLLGPDKIIGVSAHSVDQARAAQAEGADYLGVGPVYATSSKDDALAPQGLQLIREVAAAVDLPFVGIGGINTGNAAAVIAAGATGIAVISAVISAPDVAAAARQLCREIACGRQIRSEGK